MPVDCRPRRTRRRRTTSCRRAGQSRAGGRNRQARYADSATKNAARLAAMPRPSVRQSGSSTPRRSSRSSCRAALKRTTRSFQKSFSVSQPERDLHPQVARVAQASRHRFEFAHRADQPALDALRGHRRRRIDAQPAAALDPDLGPRVRVALPHDQVAAQGIELAALVAGDDPGRHAGRAHHQRERRGVVLAEAATGLEQELVHRVFRELRRVERVDERLLAKHRQHRLRDRSRIAVLGGQSAGQCATARVAFLRQLQALAAQRLSAVRRRR